MGYAALKAEAFDTLVMKRGADRAQLLEELVAQLLAAPVDGDRQEFGKLFRQAKKVLELSDSQLSEMFDVSRPTIGRWERGEFAPHPLGRRPLLRQLVKVAREKLRLQH
jgi:DNA-binding transcriptional regulator YiaG